MNWSPDLNISSDVEDAAPRVAGRGFAKKKRGEAGARDI